MIDITDDLPARAETQGGRAAADRARAGRPGPPRADRRRPGTQAPRRSVRSTTCCRLLALKLTGTRRVSHVDDLAADPGAGLFAGLAALPKTTALTSYSYRLEHCPPDRPTHRTGQEDDRREPDHRRRRGPGPGLPRHHALGRKTSPWRRTTCPTRSQRTRSVLSFFAQDGASQTLVYANADLIQSHPSRRGAGVRRALEDPDRTADPRRLVMDQKVTNQNGARRTATTRGIGFITLRMRSTKP